MSPFSALAARPDLGFYRNGSGSLPYAGSRAEARCRNQSPPQYGSPRCTEQWNGRDCWARDNDREEQEGSLNKTRSATARASLSGKSAIHRTDHRSPPSAREFDGRAPDDRGLAGLSSISVRISRPT